MMGFYEREAERQQEEAARVPELERRIEELERVRFDGWKEATIAWAVCASLHREYAKDKDPFFTKRQGDFVKHENDARAVLEKKS